MSINKRLLMIVPLLKSCLGIAGKENTIYSIRVSGIAKINILITESTVDNSLLAISSVRS
jgi:hypothetical protein